MSLTNNKLLPELKEIKKDLEETKENLKVIKQLLQEKEWTCDECKEFFTNKPYKEINKYKFCSLECFEDWSNDY